MQNNSNENKNSAEKSCIHPEHIAVSQHHPSDAPDHPCSPGGADESAAVDWPLANGGITKISPGDVDAVAQRVWRAVMAAKRTYACTTMDHRRVYLHRFISGDLRYWDEVKGWRAVPIDHANGDSLDNRRPNLRPCTPRQNLQNSVGRPTARQSRFKGVSWRRNAKKRPWRAVITVDGRQVHGGYFESEEAAAQRYNDLAREHFGEFARLNDVDDAPT